MKSRSLFVRYSNKTEFAADTLAKPERVGGKQESIRVSQAVIVLSDEVA